MRLTFKEIRDEIGKIVPKDIDYQVTLEAASIAIVTKTPVKFGGGDGLVGRIAKRIKRRVVIRPDPSIMMDEDEAIKVLNEVIPEQAGITDTWFDGAVSTIIVHCHDPGLAVGKRGANLKELRDKCRHKNLSAGGKKIELAERLLLSDTI